MFLLCRKIVCIVLCLVITCSARAEIAQQEELLQGLNTSDNKKNIVGGYELIQISIVVFYKLHYSSNLWNSFSHACIHHMV